MIGKDHLLKILAVSFLLTWLPHLIQARGGGFPAKEPTRFAEIKTVDPNATRETKALFANLKSMNRETVLFGHQDALAYGVEWDDWHRRKSDVHDVCGKYPAVFGWDLSKLGKHAYNIDSVDFAHMQRWMVQAYKMGGINTLSWHFDNFVSAGDSWDVGDSVIAHILPGGSHHPAFLAKLDTFAEFVSGITHGVLRKKAVPLVFRPFHEHTGSWFWWGAKYASPEEYKQLWQFTVHYLRDKKQLHNLLYCYSPDIFEDQAHYLERYPGDAYVDILGLDNYHDVGAKGEESEFLHRLRMVVELAQEKGKVAALTETGFESIPQPDWWTQRILNPIKNDPVASGIAWIMVWRNDRPDHHYAPYPGHPSASDFIAFSQDGFMKFSGDHKNLYRLKKK